MLKLDKDIGNPFPAEHEWLYNLINRYENIDKYSVYSLFKENTDYISLRQEFMITILKGTERYYDINKFKDAYNSVQAVIQLWITDPVHKNKDKWTAAYSAARSAAYSASESAARSASYSAAYSAAYSAYSAYSAAYSAYSAYSAESAARSASYSARSAAYSASEKEQVELIISLIKKYSV